MGTSIKNFNNHTPGSRTWRWIALVLCAAVVAARALEQLVHDQPDYARNFSPVWIPFAAAVLAALGIMRLNDHPRWLRMQRVLLWSGILMMVWTANGLPFDLLRLTPLIPLEVDWPGLVTRILALAAVVVLVRIALARPADSSYTRTASWYGYAAFVLALPYPFLRTWWALGGTPGLTQPGAAGPGWTAWLACIPWLLAAILSLLLVIKHNLISRRMLLAAGWSATAIVAMIGPAAFWSLVSRLISGADFASEGIGMASWVPALFYTSWFLWAIAAGAATRSYQLRTA